MKRVSTLFARGIVYLVGIAALAVCFILLPELAREAAEDNPANASLTLPFLAAAYLLAVPFVFALYQTHKLLNYIDRNMAFTTQSIRILRNIKLSAIIFSVMVVVVVLGGISMVRGIDPKEDITFLIPLGFIFTFISSVLAIFVAVLQKLLTDAVALKSENDLIV